MGMYRLFIIAGVLLGVSLACGRPSPTPSPPPLATPTPGAPTAQRATPSATASPLPSPTPPRPSEPSATPSPTSPPAPSPTPTSPLTPTPSAPEISVPAGFRADLYFRGLSAPTSLAFGPDGRLYVAESGGRVVAIEDRDGDDRGDNIAEVATGFTAPQGLAWKGSDLYVSSRGKVTILRDSNGDGSLDNRRDIITGLPSGRHQNNGLAFGPDGKLYLTVGSTCDVCQEPDPRSATIMRFNPDGSGGEVFARGLRNVYDIAFHPEDGTLFGADNGRDDLGMAVPEDLNHIVQGGHYGWPGCYDTGRGTGCTGTTPPVVELEPRSSADGLAFYTGSQFPTQYRNNIFIALYGAHDRRTGMKVQRIVLTRRGDSYAATVEDFATGFDRPLDVTIAPDGSLLVADFGRGMVYRISRVGG